MHWMRRCGRGDVHAPKNGRRIRLQDGVRIGAGPVCRRGRGFRPFNGHRACRPRGWTTGDRGRHSQHAGGELRQCRRRGGHSSDLRRRAPSGRQRDRVVGVGRRIGLSGRLAGQEAVRGECGPERDSVSAWAAGHQPWGESGGGHLGFGLSGGDPCILRRDPTVVRGPRGRSGQVAAGWNRHFCGGGKPRDSPCSRTRCHNRRRRWLRDGSPGRDLGKFHQGSRRRWRGRPGSPRSLHRSGRVRRGGRVSWIAGQDTVPRIEPTDAQGSRGGRCPRKRERRLPAKAGACGCDAPSGLGRRGQRGADHVRRRLEIRRAGCSGLGLGFGYGILGWHRWFRGRVIPG